MNFMYKEMKSLMNEFDKEIKALNGVMDWHFSKDTDEEPYEISIHYEKPATDLNCVATIDWAHDRRYGGRRTFNVCTYNEDFDISARNFKKLRKLQRITVKYSNKFWKTENR